MAITLPLIIFAVSAGLLVISLYLVLGYFLKTTPYSRLITGAKKNKTYLYVGIALSVVFIILTPVTYRWFKSSQQKAENLALIKAASTPAVSAVAVGAGPAYASTSFLPGVAIPQPGPATATLGASFG